MRPDELKVVFDVYPPYAVGKFRLNVGKAYTAKKVDDSIGLYAMEDDAGVQLNLTTYGSGYTNGGCWHILDQADS